MSKEKNREYQQTLDELERAFGKTIQPQKHRKNPFRSKPVPKSKIEWAIQNTRSIRAASKFLGVSYNTFKKYAKMYDLFEQNKNAAGVGVNKGGDRFNTKGWLSSILSGNHPKYPDHKLLKRLISVGWLIQECSNCGYSEFRKSDSQSPLILDYIDKDKSNRDLSNLRALCFNCFFILNINKNTMTSTPESGDSLAINIKRIKTWEEKGEDGDEEESED